MAFTSSGSASILNGLIGRSTSVPLSNCYLGLSSTVPNTDGTNFTEPPSASGYARAIIGLQNQTATQVMDTPSGGVTQNKDGHYFGHSFYPPLFMCLFVYVSFNTADGIGHRAVAALLRKTF